MKVIKDRKNDKRQKYETETNNSRDQGTIIKDLDDGQSEEADKDSNEKTSLRCAADKDVCCSIPQSCWWPKTKVIPLPPSPTLLCNCSPLFATAARDIALCCRFKSESSNGRHIRVFLWKRIVQNPMLHLFGQKYPVGRRLTVENEKQSESKGTNSWGPWWGSRAKCIYVFV